MIKLGVQYLENYSDDWARITRDEFNSGFDLRAAVKEVLALNVGCRRLVPLGVKMEIPVNWEVQIRPRSGLAVKHGITVLNTPGTVDSGYRGEWMVLLMNCGHVPFYINPGDRICQGVLCEVPKFEIVEVFAVGDSERGENGFGSSGVN